MEAILLISHGSRSEIAGEEVADLARQIQARSGVSIVEHCFLEVNQPSIPEGIIKCVERGGTHITVLLNFLNTGNHVAKDIPEIIKEMTIRYPEVKYRITPPIGQHPGLIDLFLDRLSAEGGS